MPFLSIAAIAVAATVFFLLFLWASFVSEPLSKVDTITMYGEGNNAQMVGDITKSISQINAGLGDSLGLDLQQLFSALVGAKLVSPTISEAVEEGVRDAIPKPPQE